MRPRHRRDARDALHVEGHGDSSGLDTTDVSVQPGTVHLDPADTSQYTFDLGWHYSDRIVGPVESADRDAAIAQMSANQTDGPRSFAGPAAIPGWNDLDYYGNWYPVEGYGDVWTPSDVGSDFDPFGYGYWGNFSGYGNTWISGYPWGWLPLPLRRVELFSLRMGLGSGRLWSRLVAHCDRMEYAFRAIACRAGREGLADRSQPGPSAPLGTRARSSRSRNRSAWPVGMTQAILVRRYCCMQPRPDRVRLPTAARAQPLQVDGNVIQPHSGSAGLDANPARHDGEIELIVNSGPHVGVPVGTNAYRFIPATQPARVRRAETWLQRAQRNNVDRTLGSTPGQGESRPVGRSTYTPARAGPCIAASRLPRHVSPAAGGGGTTCRIRRLLPGQPC